jgi:proteic killer suppression protein
LIWFVWSIWLVSFNQINKTNQTTVFLCWLNEACTVQDMALPGYGLHPLKGKLAGFWSVSVLGNWRIVFQFEDGMAHDVDLIDYH